MSVLFRSAVAPANTIGFKDQLDAVGEFDAVKGDGPAFFEANRDLFRLDLDIVAPECHTHDGFDDLDAGIQVFQIWLRGWRPTCSSRSNRPFQPHLVVETGLRSEEHTSELQSLMRISYAVFCLKKKKQTQS